MKKVYVTSDKWNNLDWIGERMGPGFDLKAVSVHTPDDIIRQCKDADALIIGYEEIPHAVLDALPNLKIVQFMAIGVEGINPAYAKEKGIVVANVPTYCLNEVADHVLALLLSINRHIVTFNNDVQNNNAWNHLLVPGMTRLGKSTVALLGFGNIPRQVNRRLQAFGCTVIAYDPFVAPEVATEHNVELVDLDTVCERADVISAHLPLNPNTKGMLDASFFDKCKDGVIFLNTGRGAVVDENALTAALDSGKIGFAGLDVLVSEDPDMATHPLNHRPNVILTPHVAYYSVDSERDLVVLAGKSVADYLNGEPDKVSIINR